MLYVIQLQTNIYVKNIQLFIIAQTVMTFVYSIAILFPILYIKIITVSVD